MLEGTDSILTNLNRDALLVFSAPRCVPCQRLKPNLEIISLKNSENKNVDIISVNIDDSDDSEIIEKLTNDLVISKIPSLYYFKPDETLDKSQVIVSHDIGEIKDKLAQQNITIVDNLKFDDDF